MTRKQKTNVARDMRRQNRYLQKEIGQTNKRCAEAIKQMSAEREREKYVHREAGRQIANQRETLVRAEKQIKARCTWSWWRRLRFLVTGR